MRVKTSILLASLCSVACQRSRATTLAPAASVAPQVAPSGPRGPGGLDASLTQPAKPPSWDLGKVGNLSRVSGLKTEHRDLLARQGFFLAPQPAPSPKKTGDGPLTATHLFHVYERNDYQRFPSFVTVDLAIDTTHIYFEAVLRDLEEHQLAPVLEAGISGLVRQSDKLRAGAKSPQGQQAASRAETFWAVALHLLDPAASIPKAVRAKTTEVTAVVESATGALPAGVLKADVDVTQMRPRGHYTRNPALGRYFRTMSWLGMAAFPVEGAHEDAAAVAALTRGYLGSEDGRKSLRRVLDLTAFFVGGADAAGLDQAAAILSRTVPGAAGLGVDSLTADDALARFREGLAASVPKQKIETSAREIRVLGRRAFEDAIAMQALIPALDATATPANAPDLIARLMGARAAATLLGSKEAELALARDLPAETQRALSPKIDVARSGLSSASRDRWSKDAYHGTLDALRTLFDPPAPATPPLLDSAAWRLRAVQAFAAGWAELRHDTILYGEQLGAECDAEAMEPPASWVEPVPRLYRRLAAMVRALEKRLTAAGIDLGFKLERREEPTGEDAADHPDPAEFYKPPAEKTKLVLDFLDFLAETSDLELQGRTLDRKRLDRLTTIGGEVEWILMTMANSDVLTERDSDMAVVADVFTWRPSAQVLEVAVAHPDLVFAIIPSPKGPVLARGAVMSYREFLQPSAERLTDEAWRSRLHDGSGPPRPRWLNALYTDAVGPVRPPKRFQDRCGPMSGSRIECL